MRVGPNRQSLSSQSVQINDTHEDMKPSTCLNRSDPISSSQQRDLERWQRQSESKFPPRAARRRIRELPGRAAENKAAATPTINEEMPVNDPPTPVRTTRRVDSSDNP
jgi:hypothetical protein